jgi:tetratricopeptide (TPR) repeat protein
MTVIAAWLLAPLLAAQSDAVDQKLRTARQLKDNGAAAEAAAAFEAVLPEIRASGDRALLAQTLLDSGRAALAAGKYPRALEQGQEAATLFREQHDLANEANATNLSGSAQLFRGDYTGAIGYYTRALELDRRLHDPRGEIARLNNLANAYFFLGRYLDALENYQTGLRRALENLNTDWGPNRRQVELTNLAILYEQLGQNQKALEYYKQAIAGPSMLSAAERGQLLSNLGTLYRRLGDAVKALETYREAEKFLARQHLSDAEIHVLQNVGIALALDMHDLRGASQAFSQALTKAAATQNRREIVLAHLFRGEAGARAGEWAAAARDFSVALDGARAIGATEEEWTALYGQARVQQHEGNSQAAWATLRAAIAKIESVRAGLGVSSLKAEFLANKRDVYDSAIALLLDSGSRDPEALFGMFEQARARNLRDALGANAAPPSLEETRQRLPPGAVLLEYWNGPGRVSAIVLSRNNVAVVESRWEDSDLRLPADLRGEDWRSSAARAGKLLKGIPADARHLIIVPDGALYRIPFEALALPSGRLVAEQMPVSYLPSAALLSRTPASRTLMMPWRRQLLALGDPVVDAAGELTGDQRWSRLPESARELDWVARALPGRADVHAGDDNRKQYLSESAPLLHLATHAVADAADANRSRILFTPVAGQAGSEYLFRGEAATLPLKDTDLVTLSACDTETGVMSRGEGIQSFSRAFLAAGARATVTTLWPVEDRATAEFMRTFYQHLAAGDAKAEALRMAKLNFLRRNGPWSQPLYWAAFVLNGDGQNPIQPVLSWTWIVAGVLAIAVAVLVWCLRLRSRGPAPGRA